MDTWILDLLFFNTWHVSWWGPRVRSISRHLQGVLLSLTYLSFFSCPGLFDVSFSMASSPLNFDDLIMLIFVGCCCVSFLSHYEHGPGFIMCFSLFFSNIVIHFRLALDCLLGNSYFVVIMRVIILILPQIYFLGTNYFTIWFTLLEHGLSFFLISLYMSLLFWLLFNNSYPLYVNLPLLSLPLYAVFLLDVMHTNYFNDSNLGITLDNEFFNLFIRLLVLWSNVLTKWVFSYLLTFISSVWLLLHWDCLHGLFLILLAVFSLSCTVLSIFVLLLGFDNGPLLCSSYLKTWCSLLFEIIQSQPSYLIMLHPFVSFLLFFVYAFKPFKAFLFCLCRRLFISTYHYGTSKIL